jgi:hypothetical protein
MAKSPSDFLLKVNNALYGNMEKHAYITMSVCMFDTDAKELVLVRGGHCPTFLKQNRAVAVVTPKGLGIGLAANSLFVYQHCRKCISRMQKAILHTSLLTVYQKQKILLDEEFGYEPILDVLRGVQDGETSKVDERNHTARSFEFLCGDCTAT